MCWWDIYTNIFQMLITNVLMKLVSLASGYMKLLLILELIAFLVPPSNGRAKWFILLTYQQKTKRDAIETTLLKSFSELSKRMPKSKAIICIAKLLNRIRYVLKHQ